MIRPAVPEDLEAILHVQEEASAELFSRVFDDAHPAPTNTVRERWRSAFESGEQTFAVFDDGEVVGVAIVSPPWIHALHVRPDRWGTGVSHELHEDAVERIREAGEREALIRVWKENYRGRRFWEKHGWTQLDWTERAQDPPHPEVVLYMKTLE